MRILPHPNYRSELEVQQVVKRLLDSLIAGLLLLFLAPVILLIALLIKLDSKGPAIYSHKRIGKDGRVFDMYKFRSMSSGGDDGEYMRYLQELIESERGGSNGMPYRKMQADPRITRVGAVLRKVYLDELPQFWNILVGDMGLVGPRPHVQFEVNFYTAEQRRRLSVRPGATGLWQVAGKADCSFNELIALDLEYIDNWSLDLDLRILYQTVLLMARGGEGTWARMHKKPPVNRSRLAGWFRPAKPTSPELDYKG